MHSRIPTPRYGLISVAVLLLMSACDRYTIDVTITSPANQFVCQQGAQIVFSGTAVATAQDSPMQLNFAWSSNRDGALGSGASLACDTLSAGMHRITLSVIGTDNNVGADAITVTVQPRTGLYARSSDYTCANYGNGVVWASVTLRDAAGSYVSGLNYDDFELTEQIIALADGSVKAEQTIALADFVDDDTGQRGFFPAATGGQPVDIVFLVDSTGTMGDDIAAIRTQVTALVDTMLANHVDFRIATVRFDECEVYSGLRFYGPQEIDLIQQEIVSLTGAHESWHPTWAYDALLFTPWLGFRDNARRVCVAITDIVPQSVYMRGTLTAATRTAVELYLEETGTELYYCQESDGLSSHVQGIFINENINAWAADNQTGFRALTGADGAPLAVELSWPFTAAELAGLLDVDSVQTVTDARYLFAFESSFDR